MIATARNDDRLTRLMLVAELLRQFNFAVTTPTIRKEVSERSGVELSKNSILRDLELLHQRGYVRRAGASRRGGPERWQWVGVRSLLEQRPA